MKDYYDILDVPLTATPEQIKTRYRQLVRIYHPDRFSNPLDRLYAERKLKEVNEAYNYLVDGVEQPTPAFKSKDRLPAPTVEPPLLDFGVLHPGDRQALRFQVDNMGGVASAVTFVCSENDGWFRISNGKRVEQNKTLPLVFEVVADINPALPAQQYGGWIEINMDGVKTRVQLSAQVKAEKPLPWLTQYRRQLAGFSIISVLLILVLRFATPVYIHFQGLWFLRPTLPTLALIEEGTITAAATSDHTSPPSPTRTTDILPASDETNPLLPAAITKTVAITATATTTYQATIAAQLPAQEGQAVGDDPAQVPPSTPADLVTVLSTALPTVAPTATARIEASPLPTQSPTKAPTATNTAASTKPTAIQLPTATATPTLTKTPTPLPTATQTATPTSTPAPTKTATTAPTKPPTSTKTPTPLPTATATSTPTPLPTSAPTATSTPFSTPFVQRLANGTINLMVMIAAPSTYNIHVRYTWDVASESLLLLPAGAQLPAIGRSIDNAWLQVVLPDGQLGWVLTEIVRVDLTQIEYLPVVIAPDWP